MEVNIYYAKDYGKISLFGAAENKAKQSQFGTNTNNN